MRVRLRHIALPACVLAMTGLATAATERSVTWTVCGPLRGGNEAGSRLRVVGAQMQDSAGRVFLPYGVSLVGGPQTVNWRQTEAAARAQIVAAHRYWHANAVRVQVSESNLFKRPTRGHSYNVAFARSVDRLVCQIVRQGDIPVLNVMTLFSGWTPGPTQETVRFWRLMSRRYGNRFPVIFDLYNEPQLTRNGHTRRFLPHERAWRIWQSGGRVASVRYAGMQDLVNEIRIRQGARNVIWAEEPYYLHPNDSRLALLPRHLLKGDDIVYAFHKPSMDPSSRSFRDLRAVASQGLPLVDSEWGQFAATDRPWMCQSDAYRTAPPYLQFLRDNAIGMLSWSLQPGSLVKGIAHKDTVHDGNDLRFTTDPRRLALPTEMKPSYGCTRAALGQGAGRLVMDYFKRHSARPSKALFPKLG